MVENNPKHTQVTGKNPHDDLKIQEQAFKKSQQQQQKKCQQSSMLRKFSKTRNRRKIP